jgi:hypothetical protein
MAGYWVVFWSSLNDVFNFADGAADHLADAGHLLAVELLKAAAEEKPQAAQLLEGLPPVGPAGDGAAVSG